MLGISKSWHIIDCGFDVADANNRTAIFMLLHATENTQARASRFEVTQDARREQGLRVVHKNTWSLILSARNSSP